MRRLAVLRPRCFHDFDDVGFRKVLAGTRDVPRVEGAWGGVPADDVHAGNSGTKTLHGEFVLLGIGRMNEVAAVLDHMMDLGVGLGFYDTCGELMISSKVGV